MPNFPNPVQFLRRRQASLAAVLLCVAMLLAPGPARAFTLFGTHTVDVQFATQDGKPMADAEVKVYAPGEPGKVAVTGRTDKDGKFTFETDREGLWTAEARNAAEVARATVRVAGDDPGKESWAQSPYFLLGLLGVLLGLAVWFRVLRARSRARPRQR
ncbi:MAG TPA: DUF4198 domain-containing protein [Stellaceae bacterium]|nr:DUF4198 domain-containing protein [Stellaceae bacterium]